MGNRSKIGEETFDAACHALEFLAAGCVLAPLVQILIQIPGYGALPPFLTLLLLLLGFGLQSLYASIIRRPRERDRYAASFDGAPAVRLLEAIVPVLIAAGAAYLARLGMDRLLWWMFQHSVIFEYDPASLFPYMAALGVFLPLLCGILLWFFPPERFANAHSFLPVFAAGIVITLFLAAFVHTRAFTALCTACCFLFVVSTLLVFNQTHISRTYRGSQVSVLTPSARIFNAQMVAGMIGVILLATALFYIVISGVTTLVRAVVLVALYKLFQQEETLDEIGMDDPDLAAGRMEKMIYGDSVATKVFFYIFILLAAGAGLWMVFGRRGRGRAIVDWLRRLIADIVAFCSTAFWAMTHALLDEEEVEILNYKDEETKLQDAAIRAYSAVAGREDSYAAFLSRLNALATTEEKMSFAYRTMLRVYRGLHVPLRTSDTPREAAEKIRRSAVTDIDGITEALELVMYAEQDVGARGSDAIAAMCAVIKKHMY